MNTLQFVSKKFNTTSDTIGAFTSTLCLIHCLLSPLVFVLLIGGTTAWWGLIDYLFLGIALVAIYYSAQKTVLPWMPIALYGSWLLLAFFILNERFHILHLDHAVIFLPTISLVALHLYNRHRSR